MKKLFFVFFLISIISCNYNKEYIDDESLKQNAENQIEKFYYLTKEKKNHEIDKMFDEQFFKISSRNVLNKFLNEMRKKHGRYENRTLLRWNNIRKVGSENSTSYLMIYNVHYSNHDSEEKFILQQKNDEIKIIAYEVRSDFL